MYNLLLLIVLIVLLLDTRKENFKVKSVHNPIQQVLINDPAPNMNEYRVVQKIEVTSGIVSKLVHATSTYIRENSGVPNYIIETTGIKQYKHKSKNHVLYQCMFMCVKMGGYPFGFSVTSNIMVVSGDMRVTGVQSQPLDIKPPSNKTPFESEIEGSEYIEYDTIRQGEFDLIKI
jgi:hypothetical protein|tara:strand:- start:4853 stop:5377 length:525 start_codon:yes stop_codon:yes gene_type:complete